jgi:two-component system response regulator CpxR
LRRGGRLGKAANHQGQQAHYDSDDGLHGRLVHDIPARANLNNCKNPRLSTWLSDKIRNRRGIRAFELPMNTLPSPAPLTSILVIEDDTELTSLMRRYFSQHGFDLQLAHDGRSGLAKALDGEYALIVLDVMLPVLDGFEVLRQIRKRCTTPVIMLTARGELTDRITGLNAGADDYLCKPFGPEELLARIRAVLRRAGHASARQSNVVELSGLLLDSNARAVFYKKHPLDVTSIEFEILELLMRSPGRVVTRDEITSVLHQRRSTPYERSLDVHICHLRKKLESSTTCSIRAARGVGYQFTTGLEAPV